MLKTILITLGVIILGIGLIINSQPNDFRISRSVVISAPVAKVFAQVNNFHNWEAWSPWAKLDPQAKAIYEGPASGVGAIFRWSGNNEVGEGSNTIVESIPDQLIKIKVEFTKPMTATNTAEFTFQAQVPQTMVTWSMYGKNNFVGKAMSLIMNCDKMVGGQFEKGLASLKFVVESSPQS